MELLQVGKPYMARQDHSGILYVKPPLHLWIATTALLRVILG